MSKENSRLLDHAGLFVAALTASIACLWIVTYPPFQDLPQHAAQLTAWQELARDNPMFNERFRLNWFTPYLVGNLLLYALAWVFPVTVAIKILCSIAVVSVPLVTRLLLRESGADPAWAWLAIPSGFGFGLYLGFLTFALAVPFGLLLLWLTMRYSRHPTPGFGLFIAAYCLFLFYFHLVVMGFACAISLAWLVGQYHRQGRKLALVTLPFLAPLPLIGMWFRVTAAESDYASQVPMHFGTLGRKLEHIGMQGAGLDPAFYVPALGIFFVLIALPWLCGSRLSREPRRWMPLFAGLLVFLLFPAGAFGTELLYQRLGIFLVPLYLLAFDPPEKHSNGLAWLAPAVVLVFIAVNTHRFYLYEAESQGYSEVVRHAEPGHRMASLMLDKRSPHFAHAAYLHYGSWYQAEQRGMTDFSFAYFYQQMVRFRPGQKSHIDNLVSWRPETFDFEENNGRFYDYFLVRSAVDPGELLNSGRQNDLQLVAKSGSWWLYRNDEAGESMP